MTEIPDDVRRLVRERVTSMDHIEVLMRLFAATGAAIPTRDVETSSRLGPETTRRSLEHLARAGLATHSPAADSWTFSPETSADRRAVEALAVMYNQRPVTLVKLVYEAPPAPLKLFSDAFRLRKEE